MILVHVFQCSLINIVRFDVIPSCYEQEVCLTFSYKIRKPNRKEFSYKFLAEKPSQRTVKPPISQKSKVCQISATNSHTVGSRSNCPLANLSVCHAFTCHLSGLRAICHLCIDLPATLPSSLSSVCLSLHLSPRGWDTSRCASNSTRLRPLSQVGVHLGFPTCSNTCCDGRVRRARSVCARPGPPGGRAERQTGVQRPW